MPRPFTDTEKEVLKNRLIESGKKLLNRMGMKGLTIEDAARDVGISKGSFYAFFPSKEDFVLSIFESWETQYRGNFLNRVTEEAADPRAALEHFFLSAVEILEKEPGLARLGFKEVSLLMDRLPPARIAAHKAADERVMVDAFTAWIKTGIIAERDIPALEGIFDSLFILAMHREDFKGETYKPAMDLIAEALALRLAAKGGKHVDR